MLIFFICLFHRVLFFLGCGTFTFRGAVEDSATAEISRWQVWQWIYHEVCVRARVCTSVD